jgi:hypothetical protein
MLATQSGSGRRFHRHARDIHQYVFTTKRGTATSRPQVFYHADSSWCVYCRYPSHTTESTGQAEKFVLIANYITPQSQLLALQHLWVVDTAVM